MEAATAPARVLQKRRTTNFREDETKLLIQLWGSAQIQNKLYLTHRKAPVMRLLAANMQHRGFYRTPDEIKTRLRNLKCLYHRIKRSVQSGVGIGTVDPDWPHYKAMDEILNRKHSQRQDLYRDNIFEGPRCEDIKQELVDEEIDINDDMDSYTTNSVNESDAEFEDEAHHMPPLTPAPPNPKDKTEEPEPVRIAPKPIIQPKVVQQPAGGLQIPVTTSLKPGTNGATLPFPLLILNGLSNQAHQLNGTTKKDGVGNAGLGQEDVSSLLKNIFDIQKENLELEKQRLEVEREKLEFHRLVGSRLLTMFGSMLEKLAFSNNNNNNSIKEGFSSDEDQPKKPIQGVKRRHTDDSQDQDVLKDSRILRNVLEDGIKKYMMGEEIDDGDEIKKEKDDQH